MEIHLPVHLIAAHDVVFDRMDAAFFNAQTAVLHTQSTQYAFQIEAAVARSCFVGVAKQIVHAVAVELAS